MKKMKKLLSMLLAVIMVLAMAAPSFADEVPTTGTITVSNAKKGHTYNAYKIFDLTMVSDGSGYAYTVVDEWMEFFTTGAGASYVSLNGNNVVPFNQDGANGDPVLIQNTVGLAAAIRDALLGKPIAASGTYNGMEDDPAEAALTLKDNSGNENLPLGYYLVDSTVGTLCALNTNAPDVKFEDKSEVPTSNKEILEANEDVAIGENIPYEVTITAQAGAQNYVVVDKMSKGLTFKNDVTVTKNDKLIVMSNDTYSVNFGIDTTTEGTNLTITFAEDFCKALKANDTIVIKYSADVNEDAISVNSVTNEAKLNYGHGSNTNSTPGTTVESKTYQFDLQKTVMDADGQPTSTQLAGAKFELYNAITGGEPLAFVELAQNGDKKVYRLAKDGEANTVTAIEAGYAIIKGLDKKAYYLAEKQAPAGYNAITERVAVTPSRVANATDAPAIPEAQIANSTGATLPSTGGIGTTIFYAAGIILMAGAVFFVIRRKRA